MSFGQPRTKKTKVVSEEEKLGYSHPNRCEPAEKGMAWARPLYRPTFKELDATHLEERKWLR